MCLVCCSSSTNVISVFLKYFLLSSCEVQIWAANQVNKRILISLLLPLLHKNLPNTCQITLPVLFPASFAHKSTAFLCEFLQCFFYTLPFIIYPLISLVYTQLLWG